MYTVYLINMGTRHEFKTFDAACAWCVRVCFEAQVYNSAQQPVAYFSPISGMTTFFN